MPVELLVRKPHDGGFICRMGFGEMVYAFFSSVSYHLEGVGHWGKRFPRLLLDLCDYGIVANEHLQELAEELAVIQQELPKIPISEAIYDIENLDLPIPWETLPDSTCTNLYEPWVTPFNRHYFYLFSKQIDLALARKAPLLLIYPPETANQATLWDRKPKGHDYWTKDKDPMYFPFEA